MTLHALTCSRLGNKTLRFSRPLCATHLLQIRKSDPPSPPTVFGGETAYEGSTGTSRSGPARKLQQAIKQAL